MERLVSSGGRALKWLDSQLSHRRPGSVQAAGVALTLAIAAIDYVTGHDYELTVFYLLPILLCTAYAGQWSGLGVAAAATVAAFFANWAASLSHLNWPVRLWNAGFDFASFAIIVLLFSAWHRQKQALEIAASQDALTGLANRRTFYEMAQHELGRCARYGDVFTVAYLDADDFKEVNDTRGHAAGDELLRGVAAAMRENTRRVDTVARLGGDEFAILLPETEEAGARLALKKLQDLLSSVRVQELSVTFSMGALTFRKPSASVDDMMRQVDEVMYAAKRQGKNAFVNAVWGDGAGEAAGPT
jgi:diguanylate cyclase (GGDEF)-like protein